MHLDHELIWPHPVPSLRQAHSHDEALALARILLPHGSAAEPALARVLQDFLLAEHALSMIRCSRCKAARCRPPFSVGPPHLYQHIHFTLLPHTMEPCLQAARSHNSLRPSA